MKARIVFLLVGCIGVGCIGILGGAEPTESRTWTATNGKTVEGRVTGITDGKAVLERADGVVVKVPLRVFVPDDKDLLEKHFESEAPDEEVKGSDAEPATGLPHPLGEVVGPIEAGEGSSYFVYLPKSLKGGRMAPLLFYSNASGGSKGVLQRLTQGAERGGWILAVSVESSNKLGYDQSTATCKKAVKHLLDALPIDPKRVCFTGGSGGGAQAFENSSVMKAAGVMPYVTYAAAQGEPDADDYYIIGGARDFNRYCTAESFNEMGKKAVLRYHPGGHAGPTWMMEDGMVWMNGRFLSRNRRKYEDVALDYEASVIKWLNELKSTESHRAYDHARFLKDDYGVSRGNAAALESLIKELEADEMNVRYYEGLEVVEDFASKVLAKACDKANAGKANGHLDPRIQKKATEHVDDFDGVPVLGGVFKSFAGPND